MDFKGLAVGIRRFQILSAQAERGDQGKSNAYFALAEPGETRVSLHSGECDDSSAQVMQRDRLFTCRLRVGYGETHAIRQ
jgi:hypothetical protein